MRAMILAAGLGTRLKPLTDTTPKPLVPLLGRPMVCYALDWLEKNGVSEVLINIHHHAEQMEKFVEEESQRRPRLKLSIQDERKLLLGSGGGVKQGASWLFKDQDCALIMNADALMNPDLRSLRFCHESLKQKGVLCTIAVMPHPDAGRRYNAFKVENNLVLEHVKADPNHAGQFFHFPGLYILEKAALPRLAQETDSFCIVERLWKPLIAEGKLGAWIYQGQYQDLGTVADLKIAEAALVSGKFA